MSHPYNVSVEPLSGSSYILECGSFRYLENAKAKAEWFYRRGTSRTVAVVRIESKRKQKMIDCFDGRWFSDYGNDE